MANLNYYNYYLVLDLEATCCDQETIQRSEMEIIEVGAVMVEAQSLAVIDEFQTFVKPVRFPILTEFCRSLTSITQAQVDRAPEYLEAINLLKNWLAPYPAPDAKAVFCSWGNYDRTQFKQQSRFYNVPAPIPYPHANLKKLFAKSQGLPRRCSMPEALQLAGIALEGTHHRGIDDARNIAKLLPFVLGRQPLLHPPQSLHPA
jgi:inhibitor of KinA sporulation pathway (predicted exonuclease)